jgi:hypothetical protein
MGDLDRFRDRRGFNRKRFEQNNINNFQRFLDEQKAREEEGGGAGAKGGANDSQTYQRRNPNFQNLGNRFGDDRGGIIPLFPSFAT